MQEIVKKFFNKLLDTDAAEHLVPPNNFISGQNIRIGTTDKGGVGYIENILKNVEKFHILPSGGINTTIGLAVDEDNGWIVKFNHNSNGDNGIYLYDIVSETWYDVLLEADVTGGLGFDDGELIHSARIENMHLYWCNGTLNEPRRIDIRAAVNMNHGSPGVFDVDAYTSPVSQSVISWIRRQPGLPPTAEKQTGSPYLNVFIKEEAFWFSYRYIYRGYEVSTLSGLSNLINYNLASDSSNYIYVELPTGETIDQDVLQVDLVVKHASSGSSFVIKSWNKDVVADLADIEAHNLGTPLYFDYYNDFIGIALNSSYVVKPYDSVPIYAQTIEMARNRSYMANYTLGYNTPATTSLIATAVERTEGGTLEATWIEVRYYNGGSSIQFAFYIYIVELDTFYSSPYVSIGPVPSVDFNDCVLVATGWAAFSTYAEATYVDLTSITYEGTVSTLTNPPASPTLDDTTVFKSAATYQLAIHFMDNAGRKCGVVTDADLKINIPEKEYNETTFTSEISWTLSNLAATNEIPDWAYYYSIDITKCLTTRYFLESRVKNLTYVTKDADGAYTYVNDTYAANLNGVGIDITSLEGYGMGYTFTEGDLVKLYIGTEVFTLSITAQDGKWIICELQNLNNVVGTEASPYITALFQIFTPFRPSSSEPYYEVGEIYKINNPTTVSREYSTIAGSIGGDVVVLTRNDGSNDYFTENMSPNDKLYTIWNTDAGRPNFIDTIGQVQRTNDIAYSDTIISGSKTNGLSTFEALNTKEVPLECGDIMKLQVADKIAEQGNIMLALCVRETASLYLGEAQLLSTTGNAFLAQSSGVIGTVNVLKGSYGTMNPESVVLLNGRVFFYSLVRGCFVSYSNNGLFPISDYGMRRVTRLFSQKYASLSAAEIEALGSRPFVFGGVDPYHNEVYFSIPTTETTPPKGYLEDYVSPDTPVIYPYDIYDGVGKTLVFKIEADSWGAPHNYETEYFIDIRDYLFSAKNGALYQHNYDDGTTNTYNSWYGESVKSAIGFIVNEQPNIVKEYLTLSVEGNMQPTWVHHRTELPNLQSTDNTEWTTREGVFYEKYGILRDRLSPNVTGSYDAKIYTGDKMRGQWLKVYAEFETNELLQIRFFNVGFENSAGNKT